MRCQERSRANKLSNLDRRWASTVLLMNPTERTDNKQMELFSALTRRAGPNGSQENTTIYAGKEYLKNFVCVVSVVNYSWVGRWARGNAFSRIVNCLAEFRRRSQGRLYSYCRQVHRWCKRKVLEVSRLLLILRWDAFGAGGGQLAHGRNNLQRAGERGRKSRILQFSVAMSFAARGSLTGRFSSR